MDVVVVGGGIVGLASAVALAEDGHAVRLVRRDDPIDATSSWVAGGLLTPSTPWRYPAPLIDLCRRSEALYPAFVRELVAQGGVDPEMDVGGVLYPAGLAVTDEEIAEAGRRRREMGFDVEELDRAGVDRVQPGLSEAVTSAGWQPGGARIRTPRLLKALKHRVQQLGVDETIGEVTGLVIDGDRVTGVRVGDDVLEADAVVLAAGAWSSRLVSDAGVALAVEPVRGQMLLLQGEPGELRPMIIDGDDYLIPRRDGRVLVGSTMEFAGFEASTTDEALERLRVFARRLYPRAAEMPEVRSWVGLRPGTPDRLPYLGAVDGLDGLVVATGHYRNGILLAPITARIVADVVAGREPPVDLGPFTARRPADLSWPATR